MTLARIEIPVVEASNASTRIPPSSGNRLYTSCLPRVDRGSVPKTFEMAEEMAETQHTVPERSIPELVKEITAQSAALARKELELAEAELDEAAMVAARRRRRAQAAA